jgi:hypothetical protein
VQAGALIGRDGRQRETVLHTEVEGLGHGERAVDKR